MICGWYTPGRSGGADVVHAMAHAMRSHAGQRWTVREAPCGVAIAIIDGDGDPATDRDTADRDPAVSANRRFWLWMAGEAYEGGSLCDVPSAAFSRTRAFRERLLDALLARGVDALASLDGVYQIVLVDTVDHTVTIAVDRFGGLPVYWGSSSAGTAFAGGVRGVLMAPGIGRDPDPDAIREAVTFGGFRLGTRTNVLGVSRLRGGSVLTIADRPVTRQYWRWPPKPEAERADAPERDLIAEAGRLWRRAVALRVADARRPGQTLSGGLDSRAILAEAAGQTPSWTALTYGLDRCDDARYAQRAASTAGATWIFYPLYQGTSPDWLERRTAFVQETDGLVQLADLLHCESLHVQAPLLDVHVSGYIGDVVCGTTYDSVVDAPTLLAKLPFSGLSIGWTWDRAIEWAVDAIAAIAPSAPRFAIYEHKFPQAIHLIFQSYIPYVRVRTPFTDYALFDFFQRLSDDARSSVYTRWLMRDYAAFFRSTPDQRTGLPIGTSRALVNAERLRRGAVRKASGLLRAAGLPAPRPRVRQYQDEDRRWRAAGFRERIEGTILRRESLSAEIFGRDALAQSMRDFFDRGLGPVQPVGALYTFEAYHRDLASHLAAAARAAEQSPARSESVAT
jgi:asparagine synthase (glutamine-hydrolysing)